MAPNVSFFDFFVSLVSFVVKCSVASMLWIAGRRSKRGEQPDDTTLRGLVFCFLLFSASCMEIDCPTNDWFTILCKHALAGQKNRTHTMQKDSPEYPVGSFVQPDYVTDGLRLGWISELSQFPTQLREAVAGLSESQLDTKYRNWTIRQIVHHIADSHVNSYIRFKWTLTEDTPTIKAYDEGRWSDLVESRTAPVTPSLQLLDGLHTRWCQLLATLSPQDYERAFIHPETNAIVTLNSALAYYAWHGRHHTGQIRWLRETQRV